MADTEYPPDQYFHFGSASENSAYDDNKKSMSSLVFSDNRLRDKKDVYVSQFR